jgi:hypothetical protein
MFAAPLPISAPVGVVVKNGSALRKINEIGTGSSLIAA